MVPTAPGPPGPRRLRLATRGSPLALHQADLVAALLAAAAPGTSIEIVTVRTTGDVRATESLDQIGGQGAFVKEVQAAVLDGRADLAVHSAKDLPSTAVTGLSIGAVPPRADVRDALVGSRLADLPPGAVVATGSARRRAQLANLRPDLTFVELRGNMGTRVRRATDGSVHAVVVAAAALDRLGLADRLAEVLDPEVMLPQVGQGALAVECAAGDDATASLLALIDDAGDHRRLDAERALLSSLGGSCAVPVAGWAEPLGTGGLRLHGMVASGDGRIMVRAALDGDDATELGTALAHHLLEDCGGSTIEEWSFGAGSALTRSSQGSERALPG
jgi:hydroxymethylbilane synthase